MPQRSFCAWTLSHILARRAPASVIWTPSVENVVRWHLTHNTDVIVVVHSCWATVLAARPPGHWHFAWMTDAGVEPTCRQLRMFLVVVIVALAPVHGWAPFTHQYFASLDASHSANSDFRAGASAPDAFKRIAPHLHSLQFAAHLYEAAVHDGGDNEVAFALGFGCHLCHDMVGHHAAGFLNPQEDHPVSS